MWGVGGGCGQVGNCGGWGVRGLAKKLPCQFLTVIHHKSYQEDKTAIRGNHRA